ncbi:MAG: hypothetical protein AAB490_04060 [Patescibacteria group bacterium]
MKTTWLEAMVALGTDAPEKYRTLADNPVDPEKEEVVGYAPENIRPYWVAFQMLREKATPLMENHTIIHIRAVSRPSSHPEEQCRAILDEVSWLTEQATQLKMLFYTEAKHALDLGTKPGTYDVKAGYAITRLLPRPDDEESELVNMLMRSLRGVAIIRG